MPALEDLLPVPRTLQDLLSDRVDRLSAGGAFRRFGRCGALTPDRRDGEAALGSDFDVDAALLEAEEAGVLVSDGRRLRFSHPLLASTIYGSLSMARRRALHRQLAVVAADPEEQARHLARSVRAPDDGAASRDRGGSGTRVAPRGAGVRGGAL